MATLGKIRERGVFLLIVVGLALVAFIVGDFLNSGNAFFQQARSNVGVIGDSKLSAEEYMNAINQRTEVYKIEMGDQAISDEMTDQIRQETWESLVTEQLVASEAEAIGMAVGHAELRELVMGNNISPIIMSRGMFRNQQTGMFDKAQLLNFLTSIDNPDVAAQIGPDQLNAFKNYWRFIENFVQTNRLQEKYTRLLTKVMVPNSLDAKNAFDGNAVSVDLVYAMKPYFAIADSTIKVSDSDLKALYNKKKEQYKLASNLNMSYVSFPIVASPEDFKDVEESLAKVKEEFSTGTDDEVDALTDFTSDAPYQGINLAKSDVDADLAEFAFSSAKGAVVGPFLSKDTYKMARVLENGFSSPDSVKVRRIVIATNSMETSQLKADSVLNVLRNGGDFAQLALQLSQDQQTAARGGDLGWVREPMLETEMAEKLFKASVNVPFSMPSGSVIQIMEVTERGVSVPKVKLAVITRKVNPSSRTQTKLYQEAKQFASKATGGSDKFVAAAQESGLSVVPANELDYNAPRLNNIKNTRQVIRWAIENKLNTVSDVFECDNQLIVAVATAKHEEGYRSLEDVRSQLTAELAREKKGEILAQELANKSVSALAAEQLTSDTLKNISFNTPYAGSLGNEPTINALAPLAEVGKTSAPVKGNIGVYVFELLSKTPTTLTFNPKEEVAMLNARNQGAVSYFAIEALKKAGDIEDMRYKFF